MHKKISLVLAFFAATLLLAGCKATPKTQKEVGSVNLNYEVGSKSKNTGKTIAIVSPSFKAIQDGRSAVSTRNYGTSENVVDFNSMLYNNYKRRLVSAMSDGFNEIVISKGFKITGPFSSFDDITYTDKKSTYLAFIPDLDIYIDQKPVSRKCSASDNYCEDVGTIEISGSLNLKLIEPMTEQAFLSKRINLSEVSTRRDYVKRFYIDGPQQGLIGMALKSAVDAATSAAGKESSEKPYVDNTDKVLADALNEFYSKAMKKVDRYISTEEIMSFENDVNNVKKLKRF
jgi:neuraminyllactose-binding hemagglutinin